MKSKELITQLPNGPVDISLAHFVTAYPQLITEVTRIGIAYSGGADSTALLFAALRRWPNQVTALHIHHGLQEAAETFLNHCKEQCAQLNVSFFVSHVNAQNAQGESPEDAARISRYQALNQMAEEHNLDIIFLGQHADDQVETLLLALSRGAGLPGLASMPDQFKRAGVQYARPMLLADADELRAWLKEQSIPWVEDPTNQERIYTRNSIRLDILPAIAKTFPSYQKTFMRSIAHIAQAQGLIEELAQVDLQTIGTPPAIKALQLLSPERQSNVIRYWLKEWHQTAPSSKQMGELLKQIDACKTRGHRIELKVGHGTVIREELTLAYIKT